ncbi:MAG: hypothetical protein ACXADW_13525 [Candidatus Hodarchaeales archaeon]|jgi:hypothetical protein
MAEKKLRCWEIADELKQIYTPEVVDEWLNLLDYNYEPLTSKMWKGKGKETILKEANSFSDTYHLPFTFTDVEEHESGEQYLWTIDTAENAQVIMKANDHIAGSNHAITGWKLSEEYFITLVHEDYIPIHMLVHTKEEDMMHPTIYSAELDTITWELSSTIPGIETLDDYFKMVYICRNAGEVVRDDC